MINDISPPFLNWFTSGFHQNYLLFKGYKVSSLQYTALGMGFTPLLQCLDWLSLPPSMGWKNEYRLFMVILGDSSLSANSQPKLVILVWGWWPPGVQSALINWTIQVNTHSVLPWWQHHKHGCCPVSERLAKQTKRLVLCAVQLLSD